MMKKNFPPRTPPKEPQKTEKKAKMMLYPFTKNPPPIPAPHISYTKIPLSKPSPPNLQPPSSLSLHLLSTASLIPSPQTLFSPQKETFTTLNPSPNKPSPSLLAPPSKDVYQSNPPFNHPSNNVISFWPDHSEGGCFPCDLPPRGFCCRIQDLEQ